MRGTFISTQELDPVAESAQIQKMSPKHEAILNFILMNPTAKYSEVAGHFNVTPAWLSTIVHSHAFQDQLRRRQDEFFDAAVVKDLGEKVQAAAHMTLDEYMEKVPTLSPDQLISSSDKLLGRLGFGTKSNGKTVINGNVTQNNNVQNNHVSREVLEEARSRIGEIKVGETDSLPAVSDPEAEEGIEIEGVVVRAEGAPGVSE